MVFSYTSAITLTGTGTRTFTLGGTNTGNNRLSVTIPNDGIGNKTSLVKTGPGTWLRNTNSVYTGSTTINEGILSVDALANGGASGRLGASSSEATNLVINGGALRYTGGNISNNRLFSIGTNGATILASGTGNLTFNNTGSIGIPGTGARVLTLSGTRTGTNTLASVLADDASSHATSVIKADVGQWVLSGDNTYTGPTTINSGTLTVSSFNDGGTNSNIGSSSNVASNLVINGGTFKYTGPERTSNRLFTVGTSGGAINASGTGGLNLNNIGSVAFAGAALRTLTLTGSNTADNTLRAVIANDGSSNATSLTKSGAGTWILKNTNTYTGATTVSAGLLIINGSIASGSDVFVDNGGSLGGIGTVFGTVTVADGGALKPGHNGAGTFSTGAVTLSSTSILNFELGTSQDSVKVTGDLTLDGTLNISALAGFGAGVYYLFTYSGLLTDNGLTLGTLPGGYAYTINAGSGCVTLSVDEAYRWDLSTGAGFQPGDGTWGTNNYWTLDGITLGPWPGAGTAAIFAGSDGAYTVTVNGIQSADNLTFFNSGYTLNGGTIDLGGSSGITVESGKSATVNSTISGNSGLIISGGGTLTLTGSNPYTGVTSVNGGILIINALANGGSNSPLRSICKCRSQSGV